MAFAIADEIVNAWDFDDMDAARALATRLTQEQVLLWAVVNMVGQVSNGGFSQALYNSYGQLAEESVEGLELFGFIRHAEIFDEALTRFGVRPVPREREVREARLEVLSSMAAASKNKPVDKSSLEGVFGMFGATRGRWEDLETEFFQLLNAERDVQRYQAAFYRPLAEWIYAHRARFHVL